MSVLPSCKFNLLHSENVESMAMLHQQCFSQPWLAPAIKSLMDIPVNQCFGVSINEILIGFTIVSCIPPEAEILTFCITPNHQQQGWGRKLLQHLIEYCHYSNIKKLILEVNNCNLKAVNFYLAHNFVQLSIRKDYYKNSVGNFDDAQILKLNL